jgi:haloalkane dehalogenase
VVRKLSDEEMDAYRAPFPDESSRKPVWRWPNEIPIEGEPADVAEAVGAYSAWLQETEVPKLLFAATPGALIPAPVVEWARSALPNLKVVDLGEGIHYVQEDHPRRSGAGSRAGWRSSRPRSRRRRGRRASGTRRRRTGDRCGACRRG